MTERSVTHATFVVERTYEASPARVFAAFADPETKARWFAGPGDWESGRYELDFRIGGRERASGGPPGGPVHTYEARYHDIVVDERIVLAYDMHLDDKRISVSLATVELRPEGTGTRLTFTDQGAFLDGSDDPAERERGTRDLLDALGEELGRPPGGPPEGRGKTRHDQS
jgi:uncharacterized protein YndB with AHSA1/START domain